MDDVIAGSYVFTGERSAQSYHLNKMAKTLGSAETRAQFLADEDLMSVSSPGNRVKGSKTGALPWTRQGPAPWNQRWL